MIHNFHSKLGRSIEWFLRASATKGALRIYLREGAVIQKFTLRALSALEKRDHRMFANLENPSKRALVQILRGNQANAKICEHLKISRTIRYP